MLRLTYFGRTKDAVVMGIGSVLDPEDALGGKHVRWTGQRDLAAGRRLAFLQLLNMVPGALGVEVITAKDPLLVGQQLLEQLQRLCRIPGLVS